MTHMEHSPSSPDLAEAWRLHRHHLRAVAWRILNHEEDAEDAVQEAFHRLIQHDMTTLRNVKAWLTVVVRRICLDKLGSAARTRTSTISNKQIDQVAWGCHVDPAESAVLAHEVQDALAILVDRVTPAQRTPFLLHDIFGVPYEEIGALVGRTAGACRQLASQARQAVAAAREDPPTQQNETDVQLAEGFVRAARDGEIEALAALLTPDVEGKMTIGGKVIGWAYGPLEVADKSIFYLGPRSPWDLAAVPLETGQGLLAMLHEEPVFIGAFATTEDRISRMRGSLLPRS